MSSDLEVKVSEDQTEAEVVLPGFSFGDLDGFGERKKSLKYQSRQ